MEPFRVGRLTYRQCSCGAWLGLDPKEPESERRLLERHVQSARHASWLKQAEAT